MGGCGRLAGIATIGAHRANVAPLWRRLLAGFGAYWRDRFKAVVDCSADMTRLSRRGRWVSAMLARIDFAQGFNWSGQRRWRRWKPGTEPGRWRGRKRPTEGAGSAESLWLSEGSDAAISFSELLELKEEKNCCLLLRPGFSRSSATCFGPAATGGGTDAPRGGELDICPQTNAPQEVSSVPQWPVPSGCGLWTSAPGSTPGPPQIADHRHTLINSPDPCHIDSQTGQRPAAILGIRFCHRTLSFPPCECWLMRRPCWLPNLFRVVRLRQCDELTIARRPSACPTWQSAKARDGSWCRGINESIVPSSIAS